MAEEVEHRPAVILRSTRQVVHAMRTKAVEVRGTKFWRTACSGYFYHEDQIQWGVPEGPVETCGRKGCVERLPQLLEQAETE